MLHSIYCLPVMYMCRVIRSKYLSGDFNRKCIVMASPQLPSLRGLVPRSKTRTSKSARAGLVLPISRFDLKLRKAKYGKPIGRCASVYLTAAIEYLCVEILEGAHIEANNSKKRRIIPRHIALSVAQDTELHELLKDVVFPQGGVVPCVHKELLQKKTKPLTT